MLNEENFKNDPAWRYEAESDWETYLLEFKTNDGRNRLSICVEFHEDIEHVDIIAIQEWGYYPANTSDIIEMPGIESYEDVMLLAKFMGYKNEN